MKKWLVSLLVMVFVILLVPFSAFADQGENKKDKVVFTAQEITDMIKLKERALAGISDIDESRIMATVDIQQLSGDPVKITPKTIRTTQKLSEVKHADGSTTIQYATTQITTLTQYLDDPSHAYPFSDLVECYLTIYWYDKIVNDCHFGKVHKTSVKYRRLDSQAGVKDVSVFAGQAGWKENGGTLFAATSPPAEYANVNMNQEYYCYAPSSWPYVYYSAGISDYYLMASQASTVYRGNTTWSWKEKYKVTSY